MLLHDASLLLNVSHPHLLPPLCVTFAGASADSDAAQWPGAGPAAAGRPLLAYAWPEWGNLKLFLLHHNPYAPFQNAVPFPFADMATAASDHSQNQPQTAQLAAAQHGPQTAHQKTLIYPKFVCFWHSVAFNVLYNTRTYW